MYGGDATDVSSDAGPIVLRWWEGHWWLALQPWQWWWRPKTRLMRLFRMTAASRQVSYAPQASSKLKHKIRRVWPNRKTNQVLLLHESQNPHQPLYKGGNCNNGVDCSPSTSLQYQFSIFQLPPFWPLKNALQWAETQLVWGALMLQQRVLCNWHTVSHTKVKKVCWL